MATAIPFPSRPLSSRAVFRDTVSRIGGRMLPKHGLRTVELASDRASQPNVIVFPVGMSREIQRKATEFIQTAADRFAAQAAAYREHAAQSASAPRRYRYFDLLAIGPVQFLPEPPEAKEEAAKAEVEKIEADTSTVDDAVENEELRLHREIPAIQAGQWTLICGFEWNNPVPAPAGGLSATTVLGDRPWRLRFETLNRTKMATGSSKTFTGVFPGTAPEVMVRAWFFLAPNPGDHPALFEVNATFTLAVGNQPMGVFTHWQTDPEACPPFLATSPAGASQSEMKNKFLVVRPKAAVKKKAKP